MEGEKKALMVKAMLAEAAGRYQDMTLFMKRVVLCCGNLNQLERLYLSNAFKGFYLERKKSVEKLMEFQRRTSQDTTERQQKISTFYIDRLSEEVQIICTEMSALLESHLIPKAIDNEALAIYVSLKGDYNRYLVESVPSTDKKAGYKDKALTAYTYAYEIVQTTMPPLDPCRIGVLLNFSVFLHDILQETERAFELAEQLLEDAREAFEKHSHFLDDVSISLLIKVEDNLITWAQKTEELELHSLKAETA